MKPEGGRSGKPAHVGKRAERTSISLAAFAGAHKQKYNKLQRLEKQRQLNAKKVNQYKKLKQRLGTDDSYAARVMEEEADLDALANAQPPPEDRQAPPRQEHQRRQQPGASARPKKPSHADGGDSEGDGDSDGGRDDTRNGGKKKKKKNFNALEALARKEEEARRQREEERSRLAAEQAQRQAARERAEAERKKHAALMRKRNAKGQPVMRYRVEGILEKLMKEQQQQQGKK